MQNDLIIIFNDELLMQQRAVHADTDMGLFINDITFICIFVCPIIISFFLRSWRHKDMYHFDAYFYPNFQKYSLKPFRILQKSGIISLFKVLKFKKILATKPHIFFHNNFFTISFISSNFKWKMNLAFYMKQISIAKHLWNKKRERA